MGIKYLICPRDEYEEFTLKQKFKKMKAYKGSPIGLARLLGEMGCAEVVKEALDEIDDSFLTSLVLGEMRRKGVEECVDLT